MKALIVSLVVLYAGSAAAADALGRLFFTPEQRAQLDRLRKERPPAVVAEPEQAAENPPAPAIVTYSGLVRHAGGRATVWVNNRPVSEQPEAGSTAPRARLHEDGSATVTLPRQGAVRLKVGQTAELGSGHVEESYARRPSAPQPEAAVTPPSDAGPRLRRRFSEDRRLPPDDRP